MKKIFHWGGWSRNVGDLAIQAGMMNTLQKQSTEPLEFIPLNSDLIEGVPPPSFHTGLIDTINHHGDMLLVGGGGQIMNRNKDESLSGWQFNISLDDLEKLNVPLVIYSIGYNKFPYFDEHEDSHMWEHIAKVKEKSELFSVRNVGTIEALEEHGVKDVTYCPDPAMFCPKWDIKINELKENSPIIGINLAGDRLGKRLGATSPEKFIQSIAHEIYKFRSYEPDSAFIIIPHVSTLDFQISEALKNSIGGKSYCLHQLVPGLYPENITTAKFIMSVYSQCDLVVGMRGHSNIMPFGVGTPFISLGEHQKNKFFSDSLKINQPIKNNCNELGSIMWATLNNLPAHKEEMNKNIVLCKQTLEIFNKKMLRLINVGQT